MLITSSGQSAFLREVKTYFVMKAGIRRDPQVGRRVVALLRLRMEMRVRVVEV